MMDKPTDDEKCTKHLPVKKPRLKRSSVFRGCDADEAFSDGGMVKRMKEADYERAQHLTYDKQATEYGDKKLCPRKELIRSDGVTVKKKMKEVDYEGGQHLTNDKETTDYKDKKMCPRKQHMIRSDGKIVKTQNHCGATEANPSKYKRKKVVWLRETTSNTHLCKRRSAALLKLLPSSSSSFSPLEDEVVVRDGPGNKPENYQCEEERIKTFAGWPLNGIIHSKELARVGFIYTREGTIVQCFQCGFMHGDWREGDIPLDVHQFGCPDCPFLQTLTGESNSLPQQAASQLSTQSHLTDGSNMGQFPYRSNQLTRTRLRPFMQPRGSPELPRRRVQDWEGSDDDRWGLMASTQLCIAQTERGSADHRDGADNSFKCFKSPTPSLSGSPRTPRRLSEGFAMEGGLQETERGGLYSSTSQFISHHYITEEDTEQRRRMADSVVVGDTDRVLGQYERSSSQGSINYQSNIIDDTVASEHTTNSSTTIHVVETTGVHSPPSYEQNQFLSSVELAPSDNSVGRASGTPHPSDRVQNQSPSSHRISNKLTNELSFYPTEPHGIGYEILTSNDPPKTIITYEEGLPPEGVNQYVPDM